MAMLEVAHLKKVYTTRFGGNQVEALRDVSFTVEQGEYTAIMGESGSGKTTLLNILAALDKPTSGMVQLDGNDLTQIKESRIAAFRRDHLGFSFRTSTCWTPFHWRTTSICRWCWWECPMRRCSGGWNLLRNSWASPSC